jgi:phosphoserine phosphatase RsbU/P
MSADGGSALLREQSNPVSLLLIAPDGTRTERIRRFPFTIGRKPENDLFISDPNISRLQAVITCEQDACYLEDKQSRFGTLINGTRITWQRLAPGDKITFGGTNRVSLVFSPGQLTCGISDSVPKLSTAAKPESELERLSRCLQLARKLSTGVLADTVVTMLEATLRLTSAERGFVFLRDKWGAMRLAAGRDVDGNELADDSSISHSILGRAVVSGSELVVADTASSEHAQQHSILAHDLRTVICIPLLRQHGGEEEDGPAVRGALYLDSRFASRDLTAVSRDLLCTIAAEAATLVENAQLAEAEQAARFYQQELSIAASLQQQLMNITIPEVEFASVRAKSVSCQDVGGDFFDVLFVDNQLWVVIADVCGKGIPAALLASILQGLIHAQIIAGFSLEQIARTANEFLCEKNLGAKYATLAMAELGPSGNAELINCGHIPPMLFQGGETRQIIHHLLPVGLLADASYKSTNCILGPADRLVMVTDGLTEAMNGNQEQFGGQRVISATRDGFDQLFAAVEAFRGDTPLQDD